MIIFPRLVIVTGVSAVGKSTTLDELSRQVQNSFILEKDGINQGMLNVLPTQDPRLPSFEQYVEEDSVFPDNARLVETPFGQMIEVDPKNGFYGRHARDQAYLVMTNIARKNLELGKMPIVDCLVVRQIKDGTVGKFLSQPAFEGYPRHLLHFMCEEEDCYNRHVERAARDPKAAIRDKDKISSRERFHRFITEEQPMVPTELSSYNHLLVNTSEGTPQECARRCIDYISS